jgi:adenylate cyclase
MTKWFKQFLLGSFIGLLGVFLHLSPLGLALEEKFGLEWLFHLRGAVSAPDDVIVIAIDQPSANHLGLPIAPRLWPRDLHARLIDKLTEAGARVIIFDLIFDTPSAISENDEKLAHAMKLAGNVVLVERLVFQDTNLPSDHGQAHHRILQEGSTQLLPMIVDSIKAQGPFPLPKAERVNDYWTFKASAGDMPTVPVIVLQIFTLPIYDAFVRLLDRVDPVFAAQLPVHTHEIDVEDLIFKLRHRFVNDPQIMRKINAELSQDSNLTLAEKHNINSLLNVYSGPEKHYLNFYGPPRSVTTIPYYQALQLNEERVADKRLETVDFKNKVVFVGFSGATQSEQDIIRDDYHTVFSNPDGLFISGVEIAATAFANLLEDKPVSPLPLLNNLVILFVLGYTMGAMLLIFSSKKAIALGISITLIYLFIAHYFFKETVIFLPVITPVLQVILALMLAWIIKIFTLENFIGNSRPDDDLDEIIKNNNGRFSGPCLTTDIEGYTTLSELIDPSSLEKLMINYRVELRNAIIQHAGRVIDTTGDSSLSIWVNKPVNSVVRLCLKLINKPTNSTMRLQACLAALSLKNAIEHFNESNTPPFPTRIGLHYGDMSLSKRDATYRVTGDVVNTANRIQGANKTLKTHILLSEEVIDGLDDFLMRSLGKFLLPGRKKPVKLFELITYRQSANKEQLWLCETFAYALGAYQSQRWVDAIQGFQEIIKIFPTDGPAQFFLSLCLRYKDDPPGDPWPISRIDTK